MNSPASSPDPASAASAASDPTARDAGVCAQRLRAALSRLSRQLRAGAPAGTPGSTRLEILGHLHRLGPCTPTDLAARERIKLQSLTRPLAELEAEGWVCREAHPGDRRQTLLSLSDAGRRRLGEEMRRREAVLAEIIMQRLDADECAVLARAGVLLEQLAEILETRR